MAPDTVEGHVDARGLGSHLLVSKSCSAAGTMPIQVGCAATCGHGDVRTQTAVGDHDWVHSPITVGGL